MRQAERQTGMVASPRVVGGPSQRAGCLIQPCFSSVIRLASPKPERWYPCLGGVLCGFSQVAHLTTAQCLAQRQMLLKYHLSLEHMPWTQGGPLPSSHSPSQGKLLDFCPSRDQTFAIAKLFFKKNCFWQIGLSEYNTTRAFFPLLFFPPPYLLLAPNTESLN